MRFNDFTQLALNMWKRGLRLGLPQQTVTLLGPPGIGKTSAARELANLMTQAVAASNELAEAIGCSQQSQAVSRVLDLSSMLPEDLNGLPFRTDRGTTEFAPHDWLFDLCRPGAFGVLCLDDLPAASPSMQVAARQISLERRVHEHRLAPGVFIVVTGNRREDKSSASTLPAHFRNSVMLLDIQPDPDDWHSWLASQPGANLMVSAYLRFRPKNFSMLPAQADSRGAFATPRTWAKLAQQLDVALERNCLVDVASGLVGEGAAAEFNKFCQIYSELESAEQVLADPKGTVPNPEKAFSRIDRMFAIVTALGEIAGRRTVSAKSRDARVKQAELMLLALAWVTQHQPEYVAAGLATYSGIAGAKGRTAVALASKNLRKAGNKQVLDLLKFTARAIGR